MEITHSEQNKDSDYADSQKNLTNIGDLIKKTRVEKNLTLESLAENLKINKSYLSAIEDGDYKSLPEIIYVKAMIRRIAEKLQLELDMQNVFGKELKPNKDNVTKAEDKAEKEREEKIIENGKPTANQKHGILKWLYNPSDTDFI